MRRLFLALSLAAVATAAQASPPPKEKQSVGQYVDLSPVALPIVVGGKLVNYVFVTVRINLTASADSPKMREKEPYFRDALVRAGHRAPFSRRDDFTKLDEARLKSTLLREAAAIAGARNVASVVIVSQTPKQRVSVPRPKTAPAG